MTINILKQSLENNIAKVASYITLLDTKIIDLDKQLDTNQPIFIGRGRVRREGNYFRFFRQIKLKNTDKWIFYRIPTDNLLLKHINRECLNNITKPIFKQLKQLVIRRNEMYKMLSLYNRNIGQIKP